MSARSALLLLAVCVEAATAALDTSKYPRSQDLKTGQMKIYWKVDGDTLRLALEATATGWVGFGLGETMGMRGADIVYYEKAANSLTDAYVTEAEAKPTADTCQDWTLVAAESSGGKLVVEVSRKLVSADSKQDRSITNDDDEKLLPTRVIAAWGDDTKISYHSRDNRVGASVRFFGNRQSSGTVDATVSALKAGGFLTYDFTIDAAYPGGFPIPTRTSSPSPADEQGTAYMEFCFNVPDLGDANVAKHIVGFEAILNPDTAAYIHHYTLYAYGLSSESPPTYGTCPDFPQCYMAEPICTVNKREMAWLWAPGQSASMLPYEAGVLLLGKGIKAFILQVHYDNPNDDADKVDVSGFRIYYTTTLRAYDAGMLELGDPQVEAMIFNPLIPAGMSKVTFTHDADSCTNRFRNKSITVFTRFLHMHAIGTHMRVTQRSSSGAVLRTDTSDYYDFKQAGAFEPRTTGTGFQISKGDSFTIECWYMTPGQTQRRFGLGSRDEMCIDFVYYYPLQPGVGQCNTSRTSSGFPKAEQASSIPRIFASQPPSECATAAPTTSSLATAASPSNVKPSSTISSSTRLSGCSWALGIVLVLVSTTFGPHFR